MSKETQVPKEILVRWEKRGRKVMLERGREDAQVSQESMEQMELREILAMLERKVTLKIIDYTMLKLLAKL